MSFPKSLIDRGRACLQAVRPGGRLRLLAAALAALTGAGCQEDLTEVVVVLTSDITPSQNDAISVAATTGWDPPPLNDGASSLLSGFPVSFGVVSEHGSSDRFSVRVRITRSTPPNFLTTVVVSRTVMGIPFTEGQLTMLVLPLRNECACQGTSCPNPGNPQCDDITAPTTEPFDATVAPPSTTIGDTTPVGPSRGGVMTPAPSGLQTK
jgi:hypothetical protein